MDTIQKAVGKDMSEYPFFKLYTLIDVIIWCSMCIVTAAKDLKITRILNNVYKHAQSTNLQKQVPGDCICEPAECSHWHHNSSTDPEFRARTSLFS